MMATHVVTVSPDTQIGDAARRMVEADVGAAMVVDEAGNLVGVISERDLPAATLTLAPAVNAVRVSPLIAMRAD